MANLTPTFHTPVVVKNLAGLASRKKWDPLMSTNMICTQQFTYGATTVTVGSTIDAVGLGMSEAQVVAFWQLGLFDWQ